MKVVVSAGDPKDGNYIKAADCIIIFVAVDSEGHPVEVKPWKPETEEDIAMEQLAIKLSEQRKDIDKDLTLHK